MSDNILPALYSVVRPLTQTAGQFFRGKATRASYVAAGFSCLAPIGGVASLGLCLTARDSDDSRLIIADQLNQGAF